MLYLDWEASFRGQAVLLQALDSCLGCRPLVLTHFTLAGPLQLRSAVQDPRLPGPFVSYLLPLWALGLCPLFCCMLQSSLDSNAPLKSSLWPISLSGLTAGPWELLDLVHLPL